mgnify:CR=1 FL=1
MSIGQQDVTEPGDGLRRFLKSLADIRRHKPSTAPGLRHFLDRAGPLLRSSAEGLPEAPPQPARPPLAPARLLQVLSALREPLRQAPPLRPPLNVWSVAGLKRDELRNAAVLAWFLDPHGSHGFGAAVLEAFLKEVARITPNWPDLGLDLLRVSVQTEEWPLGSETDRVDIAIDGPDFTIFIEVKIDAPEGPEQLRRYSDLARRKAQAFGRRHGCVIYLGPYPPRLPPPEVAVITWRNVAAVLSALPRDNAGSSLAHQFARHVRAFFRG